MKYTEILEANKKLEKEMSDSPYEIRVLSNIIVHPLKEVLEFSLRSERMFAKVEFGNYDNIFQDSMQEQKQKITLIFWEAANLTDGLEYKADLMDDKNLEDLIEKVKSEIRLSLDNLKHQSLVIFNLFSSLHFNAQLVEENKFDFLVQELNDYVRSQNFPNVRLIDLNKILVSAGLENAIDLRNYYSSKALYSVEFFKQYSKMASYMILPLSGKVNKALIFDCDNTLWKGILGEDGFDGVQMSGKSSKGKPFEAIQFMALKLAKQGVLIGLCSKNNAADVEEVLEKHKDQLLRNEHITIKKVNWSDKAGNLRDMAKTLNIGLDSFVFVDDSDFEIGLINQELPEVKTFKVNSKNYLYPSEFSEVINAFFRMNRTEEDLKKVSMYKEQARRDSVKESFTDIKEYLRSLEIEIEIHKNIKELIPRMAQMTQKTNQFNLTTKRYSESEIEEFVESEKADVFALSVRDKYGDSGITGLAVLKHPKDYTEIDSFLLSCRVIGRGVEDEFMSYIVEDSPHDSLRASYIRTKKNEQVKELYEAFGFELFESEVDSKHYRLQKKNFVKPVSDHIKIKDGREA